MKVANEIDLILEAKQVGLLYHFTDFWTLARILRTNTLKSGKVGYISFTRDKNLLFSNRVLGTGLSRSTASRLTIDGNALSNKFKIEPFAAPNFPDEQEERVAGSIPKIKSYIKGVAVSKVDWARLFNYDLEAIADEIASGQGADLTLDEFVEWMSTEMRINNIEIRR